MDQHRKFARFTTSFVATIFICLFFLTSRPFFESSSPLNLAAGFLVSAIFSYCLSALDSLSKKISLRKFNTFILGLLAGAFLGKVFTSIFDTLLITSAIEGVYPFYLIAVIKPILYLVGLHLGISFILAKEGEVYLSIPFIKFNEVMHDKRDVLLSESILADPRAVDFLSTGIFNDRVVLPLFISDNLQEKAKNLDQNSGAAARKTLTVIEKLKSQENLGLRVSNVRFSDISDITKQTLRLAKTTNSIILSSGSIKQDENSNIQIVDLNAIGSSLKNGMATGENIEIKVQRYGKEPKQGVGYLDDGTMVVINNGGNFIGEIIDTQVISVKQTSAGRIIFTNAATSSEEGEYVYSNAHESPYQHSQE